MPGSRTALCLGLLAVALLACGPRYARVHPIDQPNLKVTLRALKGDGGTVDRGFAHPAIISSVRVANILSRIDVRKEVAAGLFGRGTAAELERRPAIPTETLYDIAAGVSEALGKADSSQEVVVRSVRVSKRLGIFSDKFLTGMVLWVQGDELVVALTHVDQSIERSQNERLPEPFADEPAGRFKVVASSSMVMLAPNTLGVSWRDAVFRKAGNIRIGAGGRVIRREILLEEPPEEAPEPSLAEQMPADLSPQVLRDLADLEEERRAGRISEADYARRRRAILSGEPDR